MFGMRTDETMTHLMHHLPNTSPVMYYLTMFPMLALYYVTCGWTCAADAWTRRQEGGVWAFGSPRKFKAIW